MAKRKGISGWHAMRKDELVKALVKDARAAERKKAARATKKSAPAKSAKAKASPKSSPKAKSETARPKRAKAAPKKKVSARTIRKIQKAHELRGQKRDLATESGSAKKKPRDRCVLLVRDSYWLQAYWEITRETVERAKVALAEHWHTAEPVLRVSEIDDNSTTSTAERVIREIPIHGGVKTGTSTLQNRRRHFVSRWATRRATRSFMFSAGAIKSRHRSLVALTWTAIGRILPRTAKRSSR